MYANLPELERIMCKLTPAMLSIHLIHSISLETEKKRGEREIRKRIPSANIQILFITHQHVMRNKTMQLDGKHLIDISVTEITCYKNNYSVPLSQCRSVQGFSSSPWRLHSTITFSLPSP